MHKLAQSSFDSLSRVQDLVYSEEADLFIDETWLITILATTNSCTPSILYTGKTV